ncbi:MAG TPA: response regulator [Terriglobia bacterium]|jgi:DNA-binding NtrC family response regulator
MREQPKILLVGDDEPRMTHLRATLSRAARVTQAEDLPQALSLLAADSFGAVFCDWRFHCGTWRDALARSRELYPDLPVVVVSQTNGVEEGIDEWAQVVEAGAFDLLLSARSESTALSLLEHAVASGEARAIRASA